MAISTIQFPKVNKVDPCIECLVRACCTFVCEGKREFAHLCITDLTLFIDTYLSGLEHVSDPSLDQEHIRLLQICERNQGDMQNIFNRALK